MERVAVLVNYKLLRKLDVNNCKGVMYRRAVQFELLESAGLSKFISQTEEFMKGLRKVKDLKIIGCEELTSSWQLHDDRSLRHLVSVPSFVIKRNT